MKKLFTTLMVLAAALTASAQNFIVSGVKDGATVEIANGDVLNIAPEETVFENGTRRYTWDPKLSVKVVEPVSSLTGTSIITVNVTASVDGKVMFCGFDPQCITVGTAGVERSGNVSVGETENLQIDMTARGGNVPTESIDARITVSDTKETITFTVHFMTTDEAGISAPEASAENTIGISGRTVRYNLAETANFTLYNISGRAVVSRRIGGSGTLNLESFPAGVYVYRCGTATGKILLR